MARAVLRTQNLTATVVDNLDGLSGQRHTDRRDEMPQSADGRSLFCTVPSEDRLNGYNGVARLQYRDSRSPFLACASGLNCEFIFDRQQWSFEPRWSDQSRYEAQPSSLEQSSDTSVRLVIEPGSRWGVRVESRFDLVEPFFLDGHHSFTPVDAALASDQLLGVFWASYLDTPAEPGYHFPAVGADETLTSIYDALEHEPSGVIAPETGPVGALGPTAEKRLLYGVQRTRYARPLYCGRVHGMLLAMMFGPAPDVEIRFAFNASGGGPGVPAWDYQALVDNPQAGRSYCFATRLVYKPFAGLDEALELYEQWTV